MRILGGLVQASLVNKLQDVDKAIKQVLKKYKMDHFVNSNTNFAPMLYNLSRKYIDSNFDNDIKYDIIMGAFEYVFLKSLKKEAEGILEKFDGSVNGNPISIEQYISLIMRNAVINENIRMQNLLKNQRGINTFEDESFGEAVDRIMNTNHSKSIKRWDEVKDHIDTLKKYKKDYDSLIDSGKYGKTAVERLEKKKNKIQEKINELENLVKENVIYVEMESQIDEFTAEEEILFENLIDMLNKKAYKKLSKVWADRIKAILPFLINGYNKQEIAKKLKVSPTTITFALDEIKKLITDYAEEKALNNKDYDLLNSLKRYSIDTYDMVNRRKIALSNNANNLKVYELFSIIA